MGYLSAPGGNNLSISVVDRTNSINAGAGLLPAAEHVILFGDNAGQGLLGSKVIALGFEAAGGAGVGWGDLLANPDLNSVLIGYRAGADLNGTTAYNLVLLGNSIALENNSHDNIVIGQDIDTSASALTSSIVLSTHPINGLAAPSAGGIYLSTEPNPGPLNGGLGSVYIRASSGVAPDSTSSLRIASDIVNIFGDDEGISFAGTDPVTGQVNRMDVTNLVGIRIISKDGAATPFASLLIKNESSLTIDAGAVPAVVLIKAPVNILGDVLVQDTTAFSVIAQGTTAFPRTGIGANVMQFGYTGTQFGLGAIVGNALANGAAALAGTLGNAPKAGNPTKWVPFDDNGTVRYFPCW